MNGPFLINLLGPNSDGDSYAVLEYHCCSSARRTPQRELPPRDRQPGPFVLLKIRPP